jgi:coenzyme F420-dependent glucose-6-phosphate dehydrogenase
MIDEEDIAGNLVCGPDPEDHINEIKRNIKAGYDHVVVHQLGRDQFGFMEFYKKKVLPALHE